MRVAAERAGIAVEIDFAGRGTGRSAARRGQSVADHHLGLDEGFDLSWRDVALGVEGLVVTCASRQRITPDDRIARAIEPEFAFVQQEVVEPRFDRGGPEMLHR